MPAESPSQGTSRRPLLVRGLALSAALAAIAWQQQPSLLLKAIFPPLSGDVAIIQLPDGRFGLIDGGAEPTALAVELGRWLPFWQRTLAFVLLTAADSRHLPGQLGALQRYGVVQVFVAPAVVDGRGAQWRAWNELLKNQRVTVQPLQAGKRHNFGRVQLQTLIADSSGIILRFSYQARSFVLAHASDPNLERKLLERTRLTHTDLLAFPWQRDPNTALVEALRPRWLHFTDGYQTKTPVQLTYTERAIAGAQLSHTNVDGAVVWASDGQHSWRETVKR